MEMTSLNPLGEAATRGKLMCPTLLLVEQTWLDPQRMTGLGLHPPDRVAVG